VSGNILKDCFEKNNSIDNVQKKRYNDFVKKAWEKEMERAEKAREYFQQGYACSQAVALAFADLTTLSEDELKKIMLPFGGGMGRLRLTCGAVSGMGAILGLIVAKTEVNGENKAGMYEITRALCARFTEENGSLICAELLSGAHLNAEKGGTPEQRSAEYYKKRPCGELVYSAAKILEEYLHSIGVLS